MQVACSFRGLREHEHTEEARELTLPPRQVTQFKPCSLWLRRLAMLLDTHLDDCACGHSVQSDPTS